MELYDKKFVYFDWDDKLEGKKGFVAQNIASLKGQVNNIPKCMVTLSKSDDDVCPFTYFCDGEITCDYVFAYYDPYYEFRKAYIEGKQLQFKNHEGDWEDVDGAPLFTNDEYRVKPEYRIKPETIRWHVVLSDEGTLGIAKSTDKHIYFTGDEEECKEWIDEHEKFIGTMRAWEEGKTIQFFNENTGDWIDVANGIPLWGTMNTYRVKSEWYVVLDDYGLSCTNEPSEDETVLSKGTKEECIECMEKYKPFEKILLAWRQGRTIQYKENDEWINWTLHINPNTNDFGHLKEWRIKDECKGCMKYKDCTNKNGVRCRNYCVEATEYVPFDSVQELIDAWDSKYPQNKNRPEGTMPLIWIKNKVKNRVYLITDFLFDKRFKDDIGTEDSNLELKELFDDYTFLDGSIIGEVRRIRNDKESTR